MSRDAARIIRRVLREIASTRFMRTALLPGQLFLYPAVEVVPEPDELRSSFRTGQGDVLDPFQARLVLAVHHQEALLGLDQADVDSRRGGEDVGTGRGLEGGDGRDDDRVEMGVDDGSAGGHRV